MIEIENDSWENNPLEHVPGGNRPRDPRRDLYPPDQGTPHNSALPGDIAETVFMPGDPLRAQFFAETCLEHVRELSRVRNMLAYTGLYEGREVTVMGSGMGGASMGLYSFELFTHYGVERIIRIGTCGGISPALDVGDILFALSASTNSAYAAQYRLNGTFAPCADFGLLEKGVAAARALGSRFLAGSVFSSESFSSYSAEGDEGWKRWGAMGCAGTDMECYALYCNAAYLGKKALGILTCTDSDVTGRGMSAEERRSGLIPMFKIALACAL